MIMPSSSSWPYRQNASLIEYGAKEHAGTGLFTATREAQMFAPADHAGERMRMIQHLVDVDYDRKTKLIASWRNPIAIFQKGPCSC